jgi:hypothetical protein
MQSNDQKHPDTVLDSAQLKRIESVHKGFLYQHLYAVGCLFLVQSSEVNEVLVELDEDVELSTDSGGVYVQVKTRSRPHTPPYARRRRRRIGTLRTDSAVAWARAACWESSVCYRCKYSK